MIEIIIEYLKLIGSIIALFVVWFGGWEIILHFTPFSMMGSDEEIAARYAADFRRRYPEYDPIEVECAVRNVLLGREN